MPIEKQFRLPQGPGVHIMRYLPATHPDPDLQLKYNLCALGLGIPQIVLGVICIILQIVLMTSHPIKETMFGPGIWGGIIFIGGGVVCIFSGRAPFSLCPSALLVFGNMLSLSSAMALVTHVFLAGCCHGEYYPQDAEYTDTIRYLSYTLGAFGILEFVVCLMSCSVCCFGQCSDPESEGYFPFGQHEYEKRLRPAGDQMVTVVAGEPWVALPSRTDVQYGQTAEKPALGYVPYVYAQEVADSPPPRYEAAVASEDTVVTHL